jgi:hypothetical protein
MSGIDSLKQDGKENYSSETLKCLQSGKQKLSYLKKLFEKDHEEIKDKTGSLSENHKKEIDKVKDTFKCSLENLKKDIANTPNLESILKFSLKDLKDFKNKLDNVTTYEDLKNLHEYVDKLLISFEKELNTNVESLDSSDPKVQESLTNLAQKKSDKIKTKVDEVDNTISVELINQVHKSIEGKDYNSLSTEEKESLSLVAEALIPYSVDHTKIFDCSENIDDLVKNISTDPKKVSILKFYLSHKLESIKEEERKSVHILNNKGEVKLLSDTDYKKLDLTKINPPISDEILNSPDWAKNLGLDKISTNQSDYDSKVKTAIEGSFLLKILNFIFGGSLSAIAKQNSVFGRVIRNFTDIPEPEKKQSPITKEMKKQFLNSFSVKKIVKDIGTVQLKEGWDAGIKNIVSESPMAKKVAEPIAKAFPNSRFVGGVEELEESSQYSITITPNSAQDFTQIYSFLMSPVLGGISSMSSTISENTSKLPSDIGSGVKSGVESMQSIIESLGSGVGDNSKFMVDIFVPIDNKIYKGNKHFSKLKQSLDYPPQIDVITKANGDIIVSWDKKKQEEEDSETEDDS